MANTTNYSKKKRLHRTFGFSAHPEKIAELKELFFKTCFVMTQEFKVKEDEVVKLAKSKDVPVRLGKRKIMSQSELLLQIINNFYKEKDIEKKWLKFKGRMHSDQK